MHRRPTLIILLTLVFVALGLSLGVAARQPGVAVHAESGYVAEALVPTTPRDFLLPGTQPNNLIHQLADPALCQSCHSGYAGDIAEISQPPETETWRTWQGSMMAQAGRDPLFFAALDVANAGAAHAGEFCLRCHMPNGWLNGRSSAADGSQMTGQDQEGVQCSVCHRLVDPQD